MLVAGEATPGGGGGGLVAVVLPVSATVFAERGERLAFADGTVGVEQDFHRAERIAQQVELLTAPLPCAGSGSRRRRRPANCARRR